MARASIPVDLLNPGQVFACLGLAETADVLLGNAVGGFDWTNPEQSVFCLDASGVCDPVVEILNWLAVATIDSIRPESGDPSTEKWGVPTVTLSSGQPFPIKIPDSPATLPTRIQGKDAGNGHPYLTLDHWGDSTNRDNVKFWAGAAGYPGAALAKDALDSVRDQLPAATADPFNLSSPQSSSFRFDWRRDYTPLDAGFSPNRHGQVVMVGYPLVELFAAIGMTHARPKRTPRNKLEYRYRVVGVSGNDQLLDLMFLRATLGGAELGFPSRDFVMQLDWPGQENQARCITNVIEETNQ